MALCKQCNEVFDAKRADASFCSDKCRKALSRTDSDIIPDKMSEIIIPDKVSVTGLSVTLDKPYDGGPDCACSMCKTVKGKGMDNALLNHGPCLDAAQLEAQGFRLGNRVTVPGDIDYTPPTPAEAGGHER